MKSRKILFSFLMSSIAVLPTTAVISCSNNSSLESKIQSLLNQSANDLFNVKLNSNVHNFNDLFFSSISSPLIIEKSQEILNFENSLSPSDMEIYAINWTLNSIELPVLSDLVNNTIEQIKINLLVSGGPVEPKIITYNLDLLSIEGFNTSISTFDLSKNGSDRNELYRRMNGNFKTGIENYITSEQITSSKLENDNNLLNISLNLDQTYIIQKKLYLFWNFNEDRITNDQVSLYIYSSNQQMNSINEIKNNCLYFKINGVNLYKTTS